MKSNEDKNFAVEEFHRGEWIPLMVKSKDPESKKKVQKIIKTKQSYIDVLNGDQKESRTRYVEIDETPKLTSDGDPEMTPAQQAKALKEEILAMDSAENIDKAIEGVTWKSVLQAAEKRKKELTA